MNTGLGCRITHHTDGFARAFACARIRLRALPADGQAAQVANPAVTLNALETLEIHTDFTTQVTFDDVLAILNGMHNLGKLLFGQVFAADDGIDVGLRQDYF